MLAPDALLGRISAVSACRKSNGAPKSTEAQAVEVQRLGLGITRDLLCISAGVSGRTYDRLVAGQTKHQRRILIKLNAALSRLQGAPQKPSADIIGGLYRAAVVAFASELNADVRLAMAPRSLSNFDAGNRAAGLARRLAFYVVVNAFEMERRAVNVAVGYSKQAASKALKEIEDARERDPSLDALILRVGELLTGKDLT